MCEAAAFLNVDRKTVYRYVVSGKLKRYGRSQQVSCKSLADYTRSKEPPEIILAQAKQALVEAKPTPTPDN